MRKGDDLTVQVGAYRRSFILPRALLGLETQQAKLEDYELRINLG